MSKPLASYKHFVINAVEPPKKRKTKCFEITNKSGQCIGYISWYAAWRQYCFWTAGTQCLFSQGCLDDISDFLGKLKEDRKA